MADESKNGTSKRAVLHFTASLVPVEGEKDDSSCSVSGSIQTIDNVPTSQPAHLIYRDYDENDKPSWWPTVTVPAKRVISFGPVFGAEEFMNTDLHQCKVEKGSIFSITGTDRVVYRYRIEKVEDLAG